MIRIVCAIACDACGVLKTRALPADAAARAVLSTMSCGRCGAGDLKLARADVDVARRERKLAIDRRYRRRHADRVRSYRRAYVRRAAVRARVRAYQRSPEMREYFREYYARPDVKARRAELRRSRARRSAKAAYMRRYRLRQKEGK